MNSPEYQFLKDAGRILNSGQSRIAYEIAAQHGPISGDAYIEAEFLAGWIARSLGLLVLLAVIEGRGRRPGTR